MNLRYSHGYGFTLVETSVTVVVAALFLIAISLIYITQSQLSGSTTAYTAADMLAYNNLRSYATGSPPIWFVCSGSAPYAKTYTPTGPTDGIPSPVTQKITATAPYGCGGGNSYPIRVVSVVQYGPNGKVVTHATYASY